MSLATRLSIFFLVALTVVLAGFSTTLYLLARSHFQRDLDERLMTALDALAAAEYGGRPARTAWQPGTRSPIGDDHAGDAPVSWAMFDPAGHLLDGTQDGTSDEFRQALERTPEVGHMHLSVEGSEGRRWRLASRQVMPPHDEEPEDDESRTRHFVVTGTPLEPVEASLRNVALTLAGVSTALLLLAATGGRRLCQRALSPVADMAAAAVLMSATDRGQRLPSPGTGDELENLADSFNGLLGRLHDALERQARFTGDASHQLRTPLTALISELELAVRRDRPAAEYREVLERAIGDARRLRRIVESLLFLARTDAEAERPPLESVDLTEWLPNHLKRWQRHARAADLTCTFRVEAPCQVRIHPELFGELIDNLLDNAFKYSPPGTRVLVGAEPGSGVVRVFVEDNGSGIDPGDLPHLFEPFFRSPKARLRGQPGFGLGLAVAHRIATAFGARLSAETTPGLGARFVLELPQVRHSAAGNSTASVIPRSWSTLG